MRARSAFLNLGALAALVTVVLGCGGNARSTPAFRGVALNAPLAKPSFTLTTTEGGPFDFVRETEGKVALLFFGYTHCPDVCPLHMANIAAVLKQMPWEERSQIRVVFVTTDPERDTPARLSTWLATFDPSFVGLTGTPDAIAAAQKSLGIGVARKEYPTADSAAYAVAHAAQVFAFARDGFGYLVYPFGIRQEDWAVDLPKLARDATGATIRRELAADARANRVARAAAPPTDVAMGGLFVVNAVVAEPASPTEAAAYLTLKNETPQEDTLVAIATDLAARAEIHQTMGEGTMRHMSVVRALPVPARSETRLTPGATHIMLFELRRPIVAGDSLTLYLSFARAGAIEVKAPVVKYAELDKLIR